MDMYTRLYLKWITLLKMDNCTSLETLLNIKWQPGGEESFGEKGYMYMYG